MWYYSSDEVFLCVVDVSWLFSVYNSVLYLWIRLLGSNS